MSTIYFEGTCNALAPICGDRCNMPKGHSGDLHRHESWLLGRGSASWIGDHSNDPGALESEARWKPATPCSISPEGQRNE